MGGKALTMLGESDRKVGNLPTRPQHVGKLPTLRNAPHRKGQRPSAGWANNGCLGRFMVQPLPTPVLLVTLKSALPRGVRRTRKQSSGLISRRTPEHACEGRERGRCPAVQERLDSGKRVVGCLVGQGTISPAKGFPSPDTLSALGRASIPTQTPAQAPHQSRR